MNPSSLPSFFVVGPPRTGTSWLHHRMKVNVSLPVTMKETRFFDRNFARGVEWYRAQFDPTSPHKTAGEIAPTYFYETEARERIAELIPQAKIVCSFRDPVERLYSFYKFKLAFAYFRGSFEEFLRDAEVMESARYAFHLREWHRIFGRSNVMVLLYQDLKADPQDYIRRICSFIGVSTPVLTAQELGSIHGTEKMTKPRSYVLTKSALGALRWMRIHGIVRAVPESLRKNPKLRRFLLGGGLDFPPLNPKTARELRRASENEVSELEALIGQDLSLWKDPRRELVSGETILAH